MLLSDSIKSTISAIRRKRIAQENKQSSEEYAAALTKLTKTGTTLKGTLGCAVELQEKGIVQKTVLSIKAQQELLDCINDCGQGIYDGTLSPEKVEVLRSKGDEIATKIGVVWKAAAADYSEGTRGYLAMIGGLSDNPRRAKELSDSISKTASGTMSMKAINTLVSDVAEAKMITDAFSLNEEIEAFLEKVSNNQATVADLSADVLKWLQKKHLTNKLKLRF